ncbi:MAG TPA: tRNA 2-thiouridine(34) synthase MnmA [Opitutaceae bacterium]|jgi:tRNA-specific 2-thiouridylase
MPAKERIVVAMSGGVDSSVAALLLRREGHEIHGAYMKNWVDEDGLVGDCPWMQDIEDARTVAEQVGIPFQVVNLMSDYRGRVVQYLLDGYERGETPNPDAMCNREIKFGVFADWAASEGFSAVATGHYARRAGAELHEGADSGKDQSYFLALLTPRQLGRARFPLGDLTKPEVRGLAREAGLSTAAKKDSQGICFIGQVRMGDFLRAYVPDRPGPIVRASDGAALGSHRGLHFYTIGQRRGIRVPSNADNERYVVVGKRRGDNALLVEFEGPAAPGLFSSEARLHSLSWIGEPVDRPRDMEARVRYRDPRVPVRLEPQGGGMATVRFLSPQRALAPGQVIALHDGPRVVGGGFFA